MRKHPVTAPQPIHEVEPKPAQPNGNVTQLPPEDDDTRILFLSWDAPLVPNE